MNDWIIPDWPAPENVKALFTTRNGGVSRGINGVYASLNLGAHVNDDLTDVKRNRAVLGDYLPQAPKWLKQVHGTSSVWIEHATASPESDAALSRQQESVCVVMVADCLPIFLCDTAGTTVGVVHAGWRGLAGGIIEQSVAEMRMGDMELMAWLGPAIGPHYFEVGEEVFEAFVSHSEQARQAFIPKSRDVGHEKKWLADIFTLARQRLNAMGINKVYGGDICTFSDPARFFSYRRDGETGRMAALIWLEKS